MVLFFKSDFIRSRFSYFVFFRPALIIRSQNPSLVPKVVFFVINSLFFKTLLGFFYETIFSEERMSFFNHGIGVFIVMFLCLC
ncbi:hypothetical protein BDI_2539 [Parabacteroides distasonis ATCC 8503]|uniref:Uncharacterized protein n=1 Tax=Parabacteroides distasonis (strain ATCC 8503 / DSM 20701 / CIP 104284 / JCM 5825 / NCTC 11152) TaxID=435591 RepID=A6LEZ5_PARD8|nr:hypothetical protein BDI_2539 [Parabacteroides distasonis ATCC 8503]